MSNLSQEEIRKLIPGYTPIRTEKEQAELNNEYTQITVPNTLNTRSVYMIKHFSPTLNNVEVIHVKFVAIYKDLIYLVDTNRPLNVENQNQYTNEIESTAHLVQREIENTQIYMGEEPKSNTYNMQIPIAKFNTKPFDINNKDDIYSFFERKSTILGTASTMGLNFLSRIGGNRKTSSKKYKKTKKSKQNQKIKTKSKNTKKRILRKKQHK